MARFNYIKARKTSYDIIDYFSDGSGAIVSTEGAVIDWHSYFQSSGQGANALGQEDPLEAGEAIYGVCSPVLYYSLTSKMTKYEQENVVAGDGYMFFYSDDGKPEVNMIFEDNGITWRVQSVNELTSRDGVTVVTKVMLRR